MENNSVNPILKWPGGKRWLVKRILPYINWNITRYIEPFIGGGAFFFLLNPPKSIISDINSDLINCYNALKINAKKVFCEYQRLMPSKEDYYFIRDKFVPNNKYNDAARLIYLLNYSWNGLYRVNKNGKFNVPFNSKYRKSDLQLEDFNQIQKALKNTEIFNYDFASTINRAKNGSLIFADPPYFENGKEGFGKYNTEYFTDADQKRLSNSLKLAEKRGSSWILTNGCCKKVSKYYSDYPIYIIPRSQVIAADPSKRRTINEYVVLSSSQCLSELRNYFKNNYQRLKA